MGNSQTGKVQLKNAREYFAEELKAVLGKHHVSARQESFEYLVDLLVHYLQSQDFFRTNSEGRLEDNLLAQLYGEYLEGDSEQKQQALRRLGDICLLVTGFFAESLSRKAVDLDYYFGMGGSAYRQLSDLQWSRMSKGVFGELSDKFKSFSDVLGEMGSRGHVQSNSDLLRLYERWLFTGSERLRSQLSESGIIVPVPVNVRTKH